MPQITLEIPDAITVHDAKLYLAMKLFEVGRLSSGQTAELAGYSKRTFLEMLGKHGVPFLDHGTDEIVADLRNA